MQGRIYENLARIGTIDPQTVSDTEVFSDVIDMSKYHRVICTFLLGDMANETIIARCVTCDSAGNNAAAFITATTLAASAAANDNDQVVIELKADDLAEGGTNANRYVKFGLVTGGSTGGPAAALVEGESIHRPANNDDLASVLEIEIDLD